MWEWLLSETRKLVDQMKDIPYQEREDIVSEIMLELVSKQDTAQKIYSQRNTRHLAGIIFHFRSRLNAERKYSNARDFFRYCELVKVSETYNVKLCVENAYIFAAIMGKPYSICFIATLLLNKKPNIISLQDETYREMVNSVI